MAKRLFILGRKSAESFTLAQILARFNENYVFNEPLGIEREITLTGLGYLASRFDILDKEDCEIIFVGCFPSNDLDVPGKIKIYDSQKPLVQIGASHIIQVLHDYNFWNFLSEDTKRWVEIVAANDFAYMPSMRLIGATQNEIKRVRELESYVQGVTQEDIQEAKDAISDKEEKGKLKIIHTKNPKWLAVYDLMQSSVGGEGYDQLLIVVVRKEMHFFGDAEVCANLSNATGSWYSGIHYGLSGCEAYWGMGRTDSGFVKTIKEHVS